MLDTQIKSPFEGGVPSEDDQPGQDEFVARSIATVQALNTSLQRTRRQQWAIAKQQMTLQARTQRLHRMNQRLEIIGEDLKSQIANWESNRPFHFFLRLPLELRDLIWNQCFNASCSGRRLEDSWRCLGNSRSHLEDSWSNSAQSGHNNAIAFVCSQLRKEYLDWLYRERPLHIVFVAEGFRRVRYDEIDHLRIPTFGRWNWDSTPDDLLARARVVKVEVWWLHDHGTAQKGHGEWTQNFVPGEVEGNGNLSVTGAAGIDLRIRVVLGKICSGENSAEAI